MPEQRVILRANDEFQLTASLLSSRRQRSRQRRFVVQGVKAIESALAHGAPFDSIWSPYGRELSAWAKEAIARSGARRHLLLAPELFAQLAGKAEPGELVALVELPRPSLDDVRLGARPFALVLDRPGSPGNLGSIVRTADAFAADALIVTGHAADLYDPQAVRASLGAIFALTALQHDSPAEVARLLSAAGLRIVGTSAAGAVPLERVDMSGPVALVFGNERAGLSAAWRGLCDELATIPTVGTASSLNLASAVAIFCNELRRQRS